MRYRVLGTLVLLPVLFGPSVATASPAPNVEMCQGKPATIVGSGAVSGTDGDDVIVLTGNHSNSRVSAMGGNDLICVKGTLPEGNFGDGGPSVSGGTGTDSLRVRTGNQNDYLELYGDIENHDIHLGGGFDELRLSNAFNYSGARSRGFIGAGKDGGRVKMYDFDKVELDLGNHLLKLDRRAKFTITGFRRAFASGRRISLTGDAHRNDLRAWACKATLRGGRGNDTLDAVVKKDLDCTPKGARLIGNKGNDKLFGTGLDDVLLGGKGFDRAVGRQGKDRCQAERRTGCER